MVSANRRLTCRDVSKRSRLAVANRASSWRVRTNARITRTPERVSRMTWLIRSSLTWMARNNGMARLMTRPMTPAMSGRTTTSRPDNGTSVRRAMMIPPTIRIGAETMTVRPTNTTQLDLLDVVRVAGDQRRRPELVDLDLGEGLDLREDRAADVAPEPIGDPRAEVDGGDRGDPEHGGDQEHQAADAQDVRRYRPWPRPR